MSRIDVLALGTLIAVLSAPALAGAADQPEYRELFIASPRGPEEVRLSNPSDHTVSVPPAPDNSVWEPSIGYGPSGEVVQLDTPAVPYSRCATEPIDNGWQWSLTTGVSYFDLPTDSRLGSQTFVSGYLPLLSDMALYVSGNTNLFANGEQYGGSVGLIKAPTSVCSLQQRLGWSITYDSFTDTRLGSPYIGAFSGDVEAILNRTNNTEPVIGGVRFYQTVTGASIDRLPGFDLVNPVAFRGTSLVEGYLRTDVGATSVEGGVGYIEETDSATYRVALQRPVNDRFGLLFQASTDSDSNYGGFAGITIPLGRGGRCGRYNADSCDGCCDARPAGIPVELIGRIAPANVTPENAVLLAGGYRDTVVRGQSGKSASGEFVTLATLRSQVDAAEKAALNKIPDDTGSDGSGGGNTVKDRSDLERQIRSRVATYRTEVDKLIVAKQASAVVSKSKADAFLASLRSAITVSWYKKTPVCTSTTLHYGSLSGGGTPPALVATRKALEKKSKQKLNHIQNNQISVGSTLGKLSPPAAPMSPGPEMPGPEAPGPDDLPGGGFDDPPVGGPDDLPGGGSDDPPVGDPDDLPGGGFDDVPGGGFDDLPGGPDFLLF